MFAFLMLIVGFIAGCYMSVKFDGFGDIIFNLIKRLESFLKTSKKTDNF